MELVKLNLIQDVLDANSKAIKASEKVLSLYTKHSLTSFVAHSRESIKNYDDFNDFITAFPNSGNKDEIILATANNIVSRAELNSIIQKFPASPSTAQLKKEYVSRSSTIIDLFDAAEKYPETNLNIEELGSKLVNSVSNLQSFYKKFPNSVYLEQLLEKVIP